MVNYNKYNDNVSITL